jgi:hypothetical protein
MRKIRFFTLLFIFSNILCYASIAGDTLTLKQALAKGMVEVVIHGTRKSPKAMLSHAYYGECLVAEIKNLTDSTLNLKMETGQTLDCDKDPVQNLIITKQMALTLKPKKTGKQKMYAMCIQQHKSSPDEQTTYHIGEMSTGNLHKFSKVIEKYNFQDYAGQEAMWAFTDNNDTSAVVSDDAFETRLLRRYIAKLKFNAAIDILDPTDFKGEPTPERTEYTVAGKMIWEMDKPGKATLELYDEDGKLLISFFAKRHFRKGEQTQNFTYTSDKITLGKSYTAKLKVKGATKVEMVCVAE